MTVMPIEKTCSECGMVITSRNELELMQHEECESSGKCVWLPEGPGAPKHEPNNEKCMCFDCLDYRDALRDSKHEYYGSEYDYEDWER